MSVIVSRALPDVRDGLKPSQRRILVAMNDLNLGPNSGRVKCAKICGDTSGNYHPHGETTIYPTLVRMAQEWSMRHVLVDKQGNFGSIDGLPPAAMRYTEARLSAPASEMLDDLNRDTVDFVATYDERNQEPVVLPSKFPNLLVNGSGGIAVGMATSIPPHNLGEICDASVHLIDHPDCSVLDIMDHLPGPDFATGGIICGRNGVLQGYTQGRSTIKVRAKTHFEELKRGREQIVVTEIPFQQSRDRIVERIGELVREGRIKGISDIWDESGQKDPVRIVIELQKNADRDVVLNQLFQYTTLQDSFSIILLALVDGRPRTLSIKELIQEFIRHRVIVIRRRTEFLLAQARRRKLLVEGLLIAQLEIDEVINTIRASANRPEAKERLTKIEVPAPLIARALGEEGFASFVEDRGVDSDTYGLTATQAEAVVNMQLGALTGLEREKLGDEHQKLLTEIADYLHLLSNERNILDVVREDMLELKNKYANPRRTEISDEELTYVDQEDLIREEFMAVTISHRGYVKRLSPDNYRAQRRGGKGITGAKAEEEDPIEHLFVASTHAYLLFFTDRGKVYWKKVYELPLQSRTSRGRALVNLLNLAPEENVSNCIAVRSFDDRSLLMATRKGYVKKTSLSKYSRPMRGGIIAIKLEDDDQLVDVVMISSGTDVLLATEQGMAIRFNEEQVRSMGRNTRGVKGISLTKKDALVGMVALDPNATLLSVCENGYGKRTPFGSSNTSEDASEEMASSDSSDENLAATSGTMRYRTQNRGGKGLRDIKTTQRNGPVVDIASVHDDDEILMISAKGMIQRMQVSDVRIIGRNTQGVLIMRLKKEDSLVALVKVPKEDLITSSSEDRQTEPSL
ncbi:MAG: DNA gyrase subunit A [Planctomycetes bacterium]|nr:DNA gyrase subunit A [Planctomycetota bacterium]